MPQKSVIFDFGSRSAAELCLTDSFGAAAFDKMVSDYSLSPWVDPDFYALQFVKKHKHFGIDQIIFYQVSSLWEDEPIPKEILSFRECFNQKKGWYAILEKIGYSNIVFSHGRLSASLDGSPIVFGQESYFSGRARDSVEAIDGYLFFDQIKSDITYDNLFVFPECVRAIVPPKILEKEAANRHGFVFKLLTPLGPAFSFNAEQSWMRNFANNSDALLAYAISLFLRPNDLFSPTESVYCWTSENSAKVLDAFRKESLEERWNSNRKSYLFNDSRARCW